MICLLFIFKNVVEEKYNKELQNVIECKFKVVKNGKSQVKYLKIVLQHST